MAIISWANIKALTDSIGVQSDRLKAVLGTGTETGSVSKAARANVARIQAVAGVDAQAGADLLQGFISGEAVVTSASADTMELFASAVNILEQHIRDRGGAANTFDLQAQSAGERYSPAFAEVYRALKGTTQLSANYVYPPATVLGSFFISGAGAGIFTDGATISSTLYAGADIEAEATSTVTSVTITAAVVDVDGETTTATGLLNGASGTKVNLVAANGKRIRDVTGVTITGGANTETFLILSKVDRTPVE